MMILIIKNKNIIKMIDIKTILNLLFTFLIYAIAIYYFIRALISQREDQNCPEGPATEDKSRCQEGQGIFYYKFLPKDDDPPSVISNKLIGLSSVYKNEIAWRRIYINSFLVSFGIFIVGMRKMPNGFELAASILVCYTITLAIKNNFDYHNNRHIENAIKSNAEKIKLDEGNYSSKISVKIDSESTLKPEENNSCETQQENALLAIHNKEK